MKHFKSVLVISSLMMTLSGCFSWGGGEEVLTEDGEPHLYIIDVDRSDVAETFADDRVLLLRPVRVVPHYREKSVVFKVGENEYLPSNTHQFFSEPSEMFTDQLRRWLEKSGLFSQVVVTEDVHADYVLDSAVTALYAEKRNAYSPEATLEMQFFLSSTKNDQDKLVFQTGLRIDVDIEQSTASNAVVGWKQGLRELLTTLEQDLSGYFSKLDSR